MSRDPRLPRLLEMGAPYPGNGLPPRPGEDRPGLSPFGRLAKGQNLGKSAILIYDRHAEGIQSAQGDMISITGDALDACQMIVTLHPPRVVPRPFDEVTAGLNQQNLTGEQTNAEVTTENFPGAHASIRWPPLEAVVEYGVGGVNTRVFVDYMNGASFSVVASFLRVHALVTQSKHDGDIAGTSAAYRLAAHAGPGFVEGRPQRTIFVGPVGDKNESDVFDVPMRAKIAKLVGRQDHHHSRPTATVGWIRFWQSPDGHEGVGDFFVKDSQCRIDIPNAALYFSVFNESGHKMKMSVIFELAL